MVVNHRTKILGWVRALSQNKLPVHQVDDVCCRLFDHHLFHLFTVPLPLNSEPSLPHLMEKVAVFISQKYEMVGLQLGLKLSQIKTICSLHQSLEDYHKSFGEMFDAWKN